MCSNYSRIHVFSGCERKPTFLRIVVTIAPRIFLAPCILLLVSLLRDSKGVLQEAKAMKRRITILQGTLARKRSLVRCARRDYNNSCFTYGVFRIANQDVPRSVQHAH